jgi:hypothetical protein
VILGNCTFIGHRQYMLLVRVHSTFLKLDEAAPWASGIFCNMLHEQQ